MKKKSIISSILILLAIILFFPTDLKAPYIDNSADKYFINSLSKAGLAYTTCRAINASISVVKESTFELEPGGIGISLAIGEVLDPIDDMTERLSDVLITAIVSLGLQKLLYEMSITLSPKIIALLIFIYSILLWIKSPILHNTKHYILKLALLFAIIRLSLPISSILNSNLNKFFFEKKIAKVQDELSLNSSKMITFNNFALPEYDGFLGTVKNSTNFLKEKSEELKTALESLLGETKNFVNNLIELTLLYVGIFIIQVIMLPLFIFWILLKLFNSLNITLSSPQNAS